MWKTIAAVMAIISSIIAITIYTTRLPEISDNVDANAKAIADNSTYIETVDNALENLQGDFDVLDAKKLYLHLITIIMQNDSIAYLKLYLFSLNKITENFLKTYLQEIDSLDIAMECSGRFFESGTNRSFVIHGIFVYQDNICFVFYDTETLTSVSANVATFTDTVLNV